MHYIQLQNGRCAYIRRGKGVPVLLLHGLGSSWQDWQPQIDALSRFTEVFALDLRGHGASEPLSAPVTVSELANDVAEFIRVMDIRGCVLVGISMGGMVGFQLLANQPNLVGAMVAINSAPSFPLDSWQTRAKIYLRLATIHLLGLKALGRLMARKLFPHAEQDQLRRLVAMRIAANDRTSYLHAIHAILGWSALPAVSRVDTPMLIISGDRDYTPLAYKRAYTAQLRNAELVVVADSGHATPLDQPGQLNALLERFIRTRQISRERA
ncbi:MAG TPA: alpha/beta hydrolase [Pseudomonas sp.]|uniref:alpha/beta fold hydrolase n=1 Tax=Pseudomonas sp. TaxID=306 RepID=UPI002CA75EB7|nr:alpha/beta hydrolase [Pseudomonas sp.]HSX88405.1 alpha/beta hydrolase [Pseudomonas sp.]